MSPYLIVLLIIIAAGLIVFIIGLIGTTKLEVSRDSLILDKSEGKVKPALRIFYFSDLHVEFCLISASRLAGIIEEEHRNGGLDAVIFGGDLANHKRGVKKAMKYMNTLADTCRRLNVPFWGVTGNHDAVIEDELLGMFPFDNMDGVIKYLKLRGGNDYIAFGGVTDSGRHDRFWMTPPCPSEGFLYSKYILLSHNPDIILHMPPDTKVNVDAIISGHIHGGQIRTPIGLEFILRKDDLPRRGIISGIHEVNGTKLLISRGTGCVLLPMRIGSKPEVNVISIYC